MAPYGVVLVEWFSQWPESVSLQRFKREAKQDRDPRLLIAGLVGIEPGLYGVECLIAPLVKRIVALHCGQFGDFLHCERQIVFEKLIHAITPRHLARAFQHLDDGAADLAEDLLDAHMSFQIA